LIRKNDKRFIISNDRRLDHHHEWRPDLELRKTYSTAQFYHVALTKDDPLSGFAARSRIPAPPACRARILPEEARGGRGGGGGREMWAPLYSVGGGESGYIAPSPTDPNIFYAGSQGALLTRFDRRHDDSRDIEPYPRFFSGENSASLPERWQWTYPIVFDNFDPHILYTSSQHFVGRPRTTAKSWTKISPDLTKHDPATLVDFRRTDHARR